jgi:hypothetical protein
MCNGFEQNIAWATYRAAMREADLAIPEWQGEADLRQAAMFYMTRGEAEAEAQRRNKEEVDIPPDHAS